MFDKFKKIIEDATPEEKQYCLGLITGVALTAGAIIFNHFCPHVPDPANRDPWLGKPPTNH